MSTRKSANRANTDSPVSTGSGDSTSTRSATRSSLQTAATTTGGGINEQDINAITTTTVTDPTNVQETKRSRRTNVRTPTTPTSTSSSCSNSKKKSDEADETSSIPGTDAEDDKSVKSLTEEIIKNEDEKKTETLTESPVRAARKRKVFDKTAIVTRKSAAMDLANANAKRVLRCDRRNSTGKLEGGVDNNEAKKRQVKKSLSSTPEPTPTTTNTLKRKRVNSVRPEEEIKRADKFIKVENIEPVEEVQTKEDEATSKDSELVDMVGIKQEINDDVVDVPLTTGTISKQLENDEQMSADYNIKKELDHMDEDKLLDSKTCTDGGDLTDSQKDQIEIKIDGDQKSIESKSEGITEMSTSSTSNNTIDSVKNDSKIDVVVTPPPEKPRRGRPPKKVLDPMTAAATAAATVTSPIKKVGRRNNASVNKEPAKRTKFSKRRSAQELRSDEVTTDATTLPPPEAEIVSLNSTEDITNKNVNITNEENVLPPPSLEKPLTVDTVSSSLMTTASEKESPSTSSNKNSGKAASLSPELVSEEISVISVKQFYKKPEFLENNLGIEKDPKLGELVQEVEKTKEEEEECLSGMEIVAEVNASEITAVTAPIENVTPIEDVAPIENSPNCSGDSLKEEERLVFDISTEDEASCSTNILGNDESNEITTVTEELNIVRPSEVLKEVVQEKGPIEEKECIDKENNNKNGGGNDEELIKSNSTPTVVTLNTLESTCDNNTRNTAVEDIVEGGGNGEDKSDIETKDKIECNKNSIEECIQEDEGNCDEQKLYEKNDLQTIIVNEKTDASCTEEVEQELENKDMNAADIKELTDLNSEELLEEAEESNMDSESLHEGGDKTKNVIIKEQEDIVMNEDESNENKENVSITTDVKDIAATATLQSIVNSPKMIENQEEKIVINKKEKKLLETPETLKQKENHLKHLGLLTHKAAVEAKIEKQRRRKLLQNNILGNGGGGSSSSSSSNKKSHSNINDNNSGSDSSTSENGRSNGEPSTTAGAGNYNKDSQEYTGTLKTVIKLNRQASNGSANSNNENKRNKAAAGNSNSSNNNINSNGGRQSLKITFQKGRGRGGNTSDKDQNNSANSGDDTYYTIQNETEGPQQQETIAHGRKSYNRYHTTEIVSTAIVQQNPEKKEEKEKIVIPEKASFHPDRVCQDQCYYCGGKFGLYDTPCHVAQLKSVERQQKILANEEKLTIDNCLCDACFRHVDRRANAPNSYKKRISAPAAINHSGQTESTAVTTNSTAISANSNVSIMNVTFPTAMDVSQDSLEQQQTIKPLCITNAKSICFLPDCNNEATHPLRRKFIRKTVKKIAPNFDMSTIGGIAAICSQHYDAIVKFLGCALCKRRLCKNNMYHIHQHHECERLEKLLTEQGIPVKFGNNTAVCKLCRYFTNLLLKPPDIGKATKKQFIRNYRKRLLHFHNVQADGTSDGEEQAEDRSENEDNVEIHQNRKKTSEKPGRKKKSLPVLDYKGGEKPSRTETNTPQSSEDGQITITGATSGQMMLDNDVMVDYDVPVPISESPSPPPPALQVPSKLQTILQSGNATKDDISIVLRSNPNISMRELFPGEEEMGLHVNVPFGNSSSVRTPEGWTRVNTFLQYDEPTRRLWEDLQKPYGNHSSFLRHLILLEKYFRNGDLVLSSNASSNAVVYSQTIQNRLRSYDNLNVPATSRYQKSKSKAVTTSAAVASAAAVAAATSNKYETSADRLSKQFSNLPVTITPKLKSQSQQQQQQNASTSSNSTLSTNMNSSNNNSNSILKSNLLSNNRSIEILPINTDNDAPSDGFNNNKSNNNTGMTRQQRLLEAATKLINNSQQESQQSISKKSTGGPVHSIPPELISINRNQVNSAAQLAAAKNKGQMQIRPGTSKSIPPNVIILPETLTHLERIQSKNWRPTLVPVSSVGPGAHLNASGPLYQTADGRRLPALVQVQSGGRPFLISIHDYNRMCILRREKLMRDQMLKGNKKGTADDGNNKTDLSHQQQQQHQMTQFQNKIQIPNKILEQNSLIPVNSAQGGSKSSNDQKNRRPVQQQQQSLLKSSLNPPIPIAPKPPGQLQMVPPSIASQQHAIILGQNNSALATTTGAVSILPTISGVLTFAPQATPSNSSWLWNNTNDMNTAINGSLANKNLNLSLSSSPASSSNSSSPSVSKQQPVNNPIILDNSLLSRIPKSLTVIPQHKSQERSRGNSIEDSTSA